MQQFKEDLEKPALYVLINRSKRRAYIGETDAFLTRLNQHIAKKDFWTEALAFISTDDSLSKTEVQYLESLAYKTAKNAHTYDLSENSIINTSAIEQIVHFENGFFNNICVVFMTTGTRYT